MGRIQRIALAEDDIQALDLGYPRAGKLFIRNAGTTDILVGYTATDVNDATQSGQFFTLDPGIGVLGAEPTPVLQQQYGRRNHRDMASV